MFDAARKYAKDLLKTRTKSIKRIPYVITLGYQGCVGSINNTVIQLGHCAAAGENQIKALFGLVDGKRIGKVAFDLLITGQCETQTGRVDPTPADLDHTPQSFQPSWYL